MSCFGGKAKGEEAIGAEGGKEIKKGMEGDRGGERGSKAG